VSFSFAQAVEVSY